MKFPRWPPPMTPILILREEFAGGRGGGLLPGLSGQPARKRSGSRHRQGSADELPAEKFASSLMFGPFVKLCSFLQLE